MDRAELVSHFFELTPEEERRLREHDFEPGAYYRFLAKGGHLRDDGVYHLPSIFLSIDGEGDSITLWDRVNRSPYQRLFRLKKATRFQREPMVYADFLCIRYVYAGEVVIRTPKETIMLRRNDILLMNAGFVHSQSLTHEGDVSFTIMLERDYLVRSVLNAKSGSNLISRFIYSYVLNSENPSNFILFHGGENDRLPRVIEDLVAEYAHPTSLGTILLEAYLQILLVEMTHSACEHNQSRESRHSWAFAQIVDEIDSNYRDASLEGLARKYGYSPDHVSRQIRLLTGMGFKDYLLETRLREACFLLSNTSLTIGEIATEVGFGNETHFYRKFRARMGKTPGAYRSDPGTVGSASEMSLIPTE